MNIAVILILQLLIPGAGFAALGKLKIAIIYSVAATLLFICFSRTPYFFESTYWLAWWLFMSAIGTSTIYFCRNTLGLPDKMPLPTFGLFLIFSFAVAGGIYSFRQALLKVDLFIVPSDSMAPTLIPGDLIVVHLNSRLPDTQEIWVFVTPAGNAVKRVQRVDMHGIWVEGDNRRQSWDSRYFGYLSTTQFIGQASFIAINIKQLNRVFKPVN
ncbi:S26 family signal peptidase [Reinekea sp. G2M2-21]|uniref:S26 family signal peptidase n=1 Tax=Reinekea sp. G2M2-21 TaxID=2788942 RepID=UPI0018A8F59E|nr:S26 family signal peptidase [Reinekea sp. G2M2-21]